MGSKCNRKGAYKRQAEGHWIVVEEKQNVPEKGWQGQGARGTGSP